jgi:hypothetical protein
VLVLLRLVLHRYWCAVFASAGVGLVLGSALVVALSLVPVPMLVEVLMPRWY